MFSLPRRAQTLLADAIGVHRCGKSTPSYFAHLDSKTDAQLCWILGMDSYRTLPTWQNWRELLHYGHLIVVDRPESGGEPDIDRALNELEQRHRAESIDHAPAGRIVFLTLPMKAISASQIRRRRIAGECNKGLLDPRVWSYINQHQLYQIQEG